MRITAFFLVGLVGCWSGLWGADDGAAGDVLSPVEGAQAQMDLARERYQAGDLEGLENATLRGLEILGEETDEIGLEASLWYWAGVAAEMRGDYSVSLERLEASLVLRREQGGPREIAGVLNSLAAAHDALGNRGAQLSALIEAKGLFDEIGEPRGRAAVANSLGNYYSAIGEPEKSLPYHEASVALRREMDNPDYLADGLYNLGVTYQEVERDDAAEEVYHEALVLVRETNNEIGLSGVLTNLGNLAGERGEYEASLGYYEEALIYDRNTGYKRGEAILTRNIAATYHKMERFAEALKWVEQAVEVAKETESKGRLVSAHQLRAEVREAAGEFSGALADLRVATELQAELDGAAKEESLLELQTRYETVEKEREIEQLERVAVENELELTREQSARVMAEQLNVIEQARGRMWLAVAAGVGVVAFILAGLFRTTRRSEQRLAKQQVELEQALAGLRSAHGELKRLYARKSEWLGFAVHDLRSPLFAIDACCAEVVAGLVDTPEQNVKEIREAANRMRKELDAWLESERQEQTTIEVHPVTTDLGELARDVVGLNQPMARAKALTLSSAGPDAGEGSVMASVDPWRWREVVDNLVSNALKFSPRGGVVTVAAGAKAGRGWIRVSDQGPGISDEDRPKLFGAFAQLSAKPSGGEKSTGLGLHLVKRLVEAHEGEITVESAPGGGAVFEVSVPLKSSTVRHG